MAITDLSSIINKLTGGDNGNPQHPCFSFDCRVQGTTPYGTYGGQTTSIWRYNKTNGANAAIPATSGPCDLTTLGAMPFNPATGGRKLRLLGTECSITLSALLIIYDRLYQSVGTLSGTLTSAQAVTGAPSRYVSTAAESMGNEIWIEIYTTIGSTQTTGTVTYINQDGVQQVSPAFLIGGNSLREDGRIIKVPLANGDTGVRSIVSVTLAASTGTAGGFGVLIARPITMMLNEGQGAFGFRDFITGIPVLPEIHSSACIAFAATSYNTSNNWRGTISFHMIEE